MSSAVCAISGVCSSERSTPLCSMKLSRLGICSRSDGTLGLSLREVQVVEHDADDMFDRARRCVERATGRLGRGCRGGGRRAAGSSVEVGTAARTAIAPDIAPRRFRCPTCLWTLPVSSSTSPCDIDDRIRPDDPRRWALTSGYNRVVATR